MEIRILKKQLPTRGVRYNVRIYLNGRPVMQNTGRPYMMRTWAIKAAKKLAAACRGDIAVFDENGENIPWGHGTAKFS